METFTIRNETFSQMGFFWDVLIVVAGKGRGCTFLKWEHSAAKWKNSLNGNALWIKMYFSRQRSFKRKKVPEKRYTQMPKVLIIKNYPWIILDSVLRMWPVYCEMCRMHNIWTVWCLFWCRRIYIFRCSV